MRNAQRTSLLLMVGLLVACTGRTTDPSIDPTAPPTVTTSAPSPTDVAPSALDREVEETPESSHSGPGRTGASASPSEEAVALTSLPEGLQVEAVAFARDFDSPLFLTHAADGSGRVYVVEQGGRVFAVGPDGERDDAPYLDVSDRVSAGGERGLLGLAFHPDFSTNGRIFVDYTDTAGDTVVSEFRATAERADAASERVLLQVGQPASNHNGGYVGFGADGFLFVAFGDGGGGGGPNSQAPDTLLGKILRIDVDSGDPYGIPGDNPFVDDEGIEPEIWLFGMRNPFRMSFDRATGDLFIGDVGSSLYEEINAVFRTEGGGNYGWPLMEGDECRGEGCDPGATHLLPATFFGRDAGCVVTGGYVYRGTRFPDLEGVYLFADLCSGAIRGIPAAAALEGPTDWQELAATGLSIASFGEDEAGELYVTDIAGGGVYRLEARTE
ncbi:MAG: PQQ-dependent sugar dehydrogenase [Chloroflexi bacterium]|nr:PQQ-dependent sugar dehydrogenase [Chloroflexota bacterium]